MSRDLAAEVRLAAPAIRRRLRAWYLAHRRDLPWRRTTDPYAIWISEVMLQQTTVATAGPRFARFLGRFPDVAALAAAPESAVLAEWSGLGYYARARNLRRAAQAIVAAGRFPRTGAALRALPGIGPYTAAAIASIALGEAVAVVDGNVIRVLARLFALHVNPKSPRDVTTVRALADSLVPRAAPGDHNQALMELGATVCTPRSPRCGACPLSSRCGAAAEGAPERYPSPPPRTPPRRIRLAAGLALRGKRLVLVPDRLLVDGHLVVPLVALEPGEDAATALARAWPDLAGRRAASLEPLGTVPHSVLERRYRVELFRVTEGARAGRATVRLVAPERLDQVPHGGLLRKASSKILG